MMYFEKKEWLVLLFILTLVGMMAIAAYPTAFWQIGRDENSGEMIYKYGDSIAPSEHLTIFPDGGIGIGSSTLSDGGAGGQALKLDVDGAIGAEIFCDKDGGFCIDLETIFDIPFITDNSNWPSNPFDGQRVYNQDCQCIQSYKNATSTWEPTYSPYMQYADSDFPLADSDAGDVVFNTDCNCLWCYDGYDWGNCADANTIEAGAFAFDCETPPDASVVDVYVGQPSITALWVPISIIGARQGPVTLTVNDNGIIASEVVVLDGTETEVILNPLSYDGSAPAGTRNFTILSNESTNGSCTGTLTIKDPGSFEFDCSPSPDVSGTFTANTSSSGSIVIPIQNATAGDITVSVDHNGFVATEYITLVGGETSITIDPLIYDGTKSAGRWSFAVRSDQGIGKCFGDAQINP